MKKNIETNPEFASEIVLSIPYCYYLHQRGQLGKVTICNGMKPFYYFADDVVEGYSQRSLDNRLALKDIPNKWLHHSDGIDGVINYDEWEVPPYGEQFKNDIFDEFKPYVVVNNIFNLEPSGKYVRYFDFRNLYDFFNILGEKGYNVIYKRPSNNEFILDDNEILTNMANNELMSEVDNIGKITDWEFCTHFENAFDMNSLWKQSKIDYSTFNLNLFSETEGFISVHGGGVQLCAAFKKPVVIYTNVGRGLRDGYVEHKNSYLNMLSNNQVYHVKDDIKNWKHSNDRDYNTINDKISEIF